MQVANRSIEICILAGGLSRRMGRNKAQLRIGRRTMLGHIRTTAKSLGLSVRVIRTDIVSRCGPLGGVYTALKTMKVDAVMFLACDMPFVSAELLRTIRARFGRGGRALFVQTAGGAGFPFVLRIQDLAMVEKQIERGEFALHKLASVLKAKRFYVSKRLRYQLQNINTPKELAAARLMSRRWSS